MDENHKSGFSLALCSFLSHDHYSHRDMIWDSLGINCPVLSVLSIAIDNFIRLHQVAYCIGYSTCHMPDVPFTGRKQCFKWILIAEGGARLPAMNCSIFPPPGMIRLRLSLAMKLQHQTMLRLPVSGVRCEQPEVCDDIGS